MKMCKGLVISIPQRDRRWSSRKLRLSSEAALQAVNDMDHGEDGHAVFAILILSLQGSGVPPLSLLVPESRKLRAWDNVEREPVCT